MGLDITVLIVDWNHVARTPAAERYALLEDAAYAWLGDDDLLLVERPHRPWWPVPSAATWFAEYEFQGMSSSYKPHFWAGYHWDDLRNVVDPALRAGFDEFLGRLNLIWETHGGYHDYRAEVELVPSSDPHRRTPLLVSCAPDSVRVMARLWRDLAPRLAELAEPFDTHVADPGRWCGTFAEFASVLTQWGEVVGAANHRGWGVVGLPI